MLLDGMRAKPQAQNFWLYDSDSFQPDPNGILAWLIDELQDAEDRGLRAWLIGHMSPGKADCLREPSRYLNRIIRRYRHTVREIPAWLSSTDPVFRLRPPFSATLTDQNLRSSTRIRRTRAPIVPSISTLSVQP